ncbi:MAG TPA: hypothetical protein VKF42_00850 [Chitinivibrionales bacterium]|nr:hypothetical protein [Chitinivibrionales bacterium]
MLPQASFLVLPIDGAAPDAALSRLSNTNRDRTCRFRVSTGRPLDEHGQQVDLLRRRVSSAPQENENEEEEKEVDDPDDFHGAV